MFRNAITFAVTSGYKLDPALLQRRIARDCGPTDRHTDGFITPCDHASADLVHRIGGMDLILWQTEDKILPGSVVQEVLTDTLESIEEAQGYKAGRKQVKEIKEQIELELLPKAFIQKRRTYAVFTDKYFIIDTSSGARADALIEALKVALGELPLTLVRTMHFAGNAMREWLLTDGIPEKLTLDNSCALERPVEGRSTISYVRTDIQSEDIRNRIAGGYNVRKAAMTFADRMSFVLGDSMNLTRLQILDVICEEAARDADEDMSRFDGQMLLSIGELCAALDYLIDALGGVQKRESDLLTDSAGTSVAEAAKSMNEIAAADGMSVTISKPGGEVIASFGDTSDTLYTQAKAVVMEQKRVSISLIQRHLRIGYNAAARLVERMEIDGIVTPQNASGTRKLAA
jgi:recombination associated protein RdgC